MLQQSTRRRGASLIVAAQQPIRLVVHVGPHKTGSTSVQRALAAARDSLAERGVWYPPSLPDAAWPIQHADAWRLLRQQRRAEFDRWLDICRDQALARGCDTLLLSSENFHSLRTRSALAAALARHRRINGGESRYLFVQREIRDLARSRALSHIAGESGAYYALGYNLRTWACDFAALQLQHRRWYARRGGRFIDLSGGPREALAARLLEAASGRSFSDIVNNDENVTSGRLARHFAVLSYGLRVMHHFASGDGVNVPASFAAARRVLGTPNVDEDAFAALVEGFTAAVSREVDCGISDFEHLGPLAREWRIRLARDARPQGLPA